MHELGIVFHIIDSIEEVGRQNKLRRVSTVTLELVFSYRIHPAEYAP